MVFDFTNDLNIRSMFWILFNHHSSQFIKIFFVTSKRNGNVVNFILQAKVNDILFIVLSDGWECDDSPRQTHILFATNFTIIFNKNSDNILRDFDNLCGDASISNEYFPTNLSG